MTAPLEVGETFQYQLQAYDANGAPVAPASVVASIERPDGTTTTPTVTGTSPALVDYVTEQEGRHVLTGTASGGSLGTAVEKFQDVFHVEGAGRYLIGVDEARARLRMLGVTVNPDDVEALRWAILNATDAVETDLGVAFCRRTLTETYDQPMGRALILRRAPVLAVSQVTVVGLNGGGPLVAGTDYVRSGRFLYLGTSTARRAWPVGVGHIAVTYTVGTQPVPPIVRGVVADVVARSWQSQSAEHRFAGEVDETGAVFEAVSSMTSVELAAYDRLRAIGGMA